MAQYLGCFAFQAARRLIEMHAAVKPAIEEAQQRLSPRQLDCVILAGRGKSDRDVGQLLGISGQTVHQHMEEAKRRYSPNQGNVGPLPRLRRYRREMPE